MNSRSMNIVQKIKTYGCIVIILSMVFSATASAKRLSVGSSIANIRSGPGTGYEVMWQVSMYHPLNILKKSGQWYRFKDFENDEGWIHKSLLRTTPSVITIKKKCNVRSGPGIKFKILFTVEDGIPFKILKRKGNWIKIQHADGDSGWIHKSLVW